MSINKLTCIFKIKKGFTLIELIVVIVIIGILAAIIVPRLSGFTDTSKARVCESNRATLERHYAYCIANGNAPITNGETIVEYLTKFPNNIISADYNPCPSGGVITWEIEAGDLILSCSIASHNINPYTTLTFDQVIMGVGGQKSYIKGYIGTSTNILIPRSLSGIIITNVYQDAFLSKSLTSLKFDNNSGITRINARAFKNNSLIEVILPDTLKNLDVQAFYGNNITKVTIGAGVTMETNVFENNNNFRTAYIAQGAGTYTLVSGTWVKQ